MPSPTRLLALISSVLLTVAACSSPTTPTDARQGDAATEVSSMDARSDVATCNGSQCGSNCVDLQLDPHHCGACGNDCTGLPHVSSSGARCLAGHCDLTTSCASGWGHCGSDPSTGCETDFSQGTHC